MTFAHDPADRKRGNIRRVTALPLACRRLNLAGVADLVEFRAGAERDTAYPVEYKRGKAKLHRADEVQLCAQALCLEEMTGNAVPEGALFYAETRRRVAVPFDSELRRLTEQTALRVWRVIRRWPYASGGLPGGSLSGLFADRGVPPEGGVKIRAGLPRARSRCCARWRRPSAVKKLLNTALCHDRRRGAAQGWRELGRGGRWRRTRPRAFPHDEFGGRVRRHLRFAATDASARVRAVSRSCCSIVPAASKRGSKVR